MIEGHCSGELGQCPLFSPKGREKRGVPAVFSQNLFRNPYANGTIYIKIKGTISARCPVGTGSGGREKRELRLGRREVWSWNKQSISVFC